MRMTYSYSTTQRCSLLASTATRRRLALASKCSSSANSTRSSAFGMYSLTRHARFASATNSTLAKTNQWWQKSSTTPPLAAVPSVSSTTVLMTSSRQTFTPLAKHLYQTMYATSVLQSQRTWSVSRTSSQSTKVQ